MSGFSKGVLLKGLPFSTSKEDIKDFFKSISIPDENIRILRYRDGKATGLAFVKLPGQDEVSRACLMDKNHIGARYVDVVASDETEMYQLLLETRSGTTAADLYRMAGASNKSGGSGIGSGDGVDVSLSVVRDRSPIRTKLNTRFCYISGVPHGNNYREIRKFLVGCLIGRNCIHLVKDSRGTFRGDGYVELANSMECLKALQFSGKSLDGSVIHLEPCAEAEVDEYLREDNREQVSTLGRRRDRTPSPVRKRKEAYVAKYGSERERDHWDREDHVLASRERENERDRLREYYDRYSEQPEERHYDRSYESRAQSASYANQYPRSSSEASAYYATTAHQQEDPYAQGYARQVHHAPDGYSTSAYAQLQHYSRGGTSHQAALRGVPAEVSMGGYAATEDYPGYRHGPPVSVPLGLPEEPAVLQQASTVHASPRERKMIRMEGLPYTITVQDVIAFFRGFHLDFEHVRIQCRDDGSPSGKAFVVFPSEKHARTAVMDYNKRYVGGRYVELFLV